MECCKIDWNGYEHSCLRILYGITFIRDTQTGDAPSLTSVTWPRKKIWCRRSHPLHEVTRQRARPCAAVAHLTRAISCSPIGHKMTQTNPSPGSRSQCRKNSSSNVCHY
ncbi:uncharacterized protein LOC126270221 [Schistocerca gregaria]|uniref:uncharacterized protein LOC126270221 n=1 Tax=Schistocerca gregaria TaxID=7010 RepID=UPI00211E6D05|nr:uncharacterized protein LOC126270221 [Schistocerca gregaria]